MDDAIRQAIVKYFDNDADFDERHEMYHEDAVLEFPQSGERFVGKANFMTWRRAYPANVTYRVRRITGGGDLWVTEILVSYDGSPPMFGLDVLRVRDGKVIRESIYVMEAFEAAGWRAEWSTPFDPLASVAPQEWRDGVEFGLDLEAVLAA
jgi:hypothetical protein